MGSPLSLQTDAFLAPRGGSTLHVKHGYHPPPGMDAFLIPFRPRPHGELTPRSSACSPPPSPNSFILNCLGRMEGASQFLSSGTTASLDARSGLLINKSQLHFDLHYSWGIWSKIGHVGNKRFKVIKYSVIRTVSK